MTPLLTGQEGELQCVEMMDVLQNDLSEKIIVDNEKYLVNVIRK